MQYERISATAWRSFSSGRFSTSPDDRASRARHANGRAVPYWRKLLVDDFCLAVTGNLVGEVVNDLVVLRGDEGLAAVHNVVAGTVHLRAVNLGFDHQALDVHK
jgi:hypothetical protein